MIAAVPVQKSGDGAWRRPEPDVLRILQRDSEHVWHGADDCVAGFGGHALAGGRGGNRGHDGDLPCRLRGWWRGSIEGKRNTFTIAGAAFLGLADHAASVV